MINMALPSCKLSYFNTAESLNVHCIREKSIYFILVAMKRLIKRCYMYDPFNFRQLKILYCCQLGVILNSSRKYLCLWGLGGPSSLGCDDQREAVGEVLFGCTPTERFSVAILARLW